MKNLLLAAFILLSNALSLNAQEIKGICVNPSGGRAEYVSIGIEGTYTGITSDGKGNFSIVIPDSLSGRALTFAHLSYQTQTIPINRLKQEAALARTAGKPLTITLTDNAFTITPITVNPQKLRLKNLNSRGVLIPRGIALHQRPSKFKDPARAAWELNFGTLLELKAKTWIREIDFDIVANTFDTLVMRVAVYRKEGDLFIPLMGKPHYVGVPRSTERQEARIDLSKYDIMAHGIVYVGLERVEMSARGQLAFPLYYGGGRLYLHNMATGMSERQIIGIGFLVKGSVLD
ncbi:MAG: carboxypeptidase-like regulatory domain-containing protein [Rikenellaceae bacterium]|jgi:hypothetical protein|nr:carboxypeptidase-like regulatory domain-containing protein [Rikenellaceae bacterium]